MSLSRLWQRHGKRAEAYQILQEVYNALWKGVPMRHLLDAAHPRQGAVEVSFLSCLQCPHAVGDTHGLARFPP